MQFAYQARDAAGLLKAGELAAETVAEVAAALRRDGLFPVDIAPRSAAGAAAGGANPGLSLNLFAPRVRGSEVVQFATQLSVMADAGVPLGQALRDLAAQSDGGGLPPVLRKVAAAVDGGETFSAALARFPRAFDPTFVNLAKAGEASGTLPEMLDRTAARLEIDLETRRKLVGAMIYPAAMLVLCLCSVAFLLTCVFPKILPLFEGRALELPAPHEAADGDLGLAHAPLAVPPRRPRRGGGGVRVPPPPRGRPGGVGPGGARPAGGRPALPEGLAVAEPADAGGDDLGRRADAGKPAAGGRGRGKLRLRRGVAGRVRTRSPAARL